MAKTSIRTICDQCIGIYLASWVIQLFWETFKEQFYNHDILLSSFGFVHLPTQPGKHSIEVHTWKIAPNGFWDKVKEKFWSGGFTLNKSDLIHTGIERFQIFFFIFYR